MFLAKKWKIVLVFLLLLAVLLIFLWTRDYRSQNQPMVFGVTFSQSEAEYLGLDWQKTYLDMLDNLKVQHLRLLAYWNQIEKEPGKFDFSNLDWQIKEARKRNAKIILVIGRRLPHWPECHTPDWAAALPEKEQQEKILKMLEKVVEHYKKQSHIIMWQVDNEPLVNWFGHCPKADKNLIKKEITLVKSLDFRPILITDSGELSSWWSASRLGDYFGTTMYRIVWNKYFGYWNYKYLFPPAFYRLKARLVGLYPPGVIISELQAEPWLRESIDKISLEEQRRSMNVKKFKEITDFAQRTGFSQSYLWGVEYWYWLKEKKNDASLYEEARELWNP